MALQLEQKTQEVAVKRHLVTLEEYERMCVAGVFDEDARIELIRGRKSTQTRPKVSINLSGSLGAERHCNCLAGWLAV